MFLAGAIFCQTACLVPWVGRAGKWWVWVVGGVLFENCTVDASIFVVKFVRANGGCLGTRSR